MRVLLYGMQSSGASVLAFTLAQRPKSAAFVDIWNMFAAPDIEATDRYTVAKVVVTTAFSLDAHRLRFRPDVTFLVLRHPVDTYDSLYGKSYANENGLIDEKFAIIEEVLRARSGFDQIVYYEDFAFRPRLLVDLAEGIGWKLGYDALLFKRTLEDMQRENLARFPGIDERLKYGAGNIQSNGVLRDRVRFSQPWGKTAHLPSICPSLFDHYDNLRAERGELWHVPSFAILSCGLHAILRELAGPGRIPRRVERAGYKLEFIGGNSRSRIQDTELVLYPSGRGDRTQLRLSGLPRQPFNRLRAILSAEHPLNSGTVVSIRIAGRDGQPGAGAEVMLCHSDMRNIDLCFELPADTISLELDLRMPGSGISQAVSGVRIQSLRLEQVAV